VAKSIECFPAMASKFFFKPFVTNSGGSSYHWYNHTFHTPHSLHTYTLALLFQFLFCFLLRDISVRWYCRIYQYACFLVVFTTITTATTIATVAAAATTIYLDLRSAFGLVPYALLLHRLSA
jgi:hypothetical protein